MLIVCFCFFVSVAKSSVGERDFAHLPFPLFLRYSLMKAMIARKIPKGPYLNDVYTEGGRGG